MTTRLAFFLVLAATGLFMSQCFRGRWFLVLVISFLDRAARALAGARIGARALAAQRQAATMAQATIGAKVDQALDADADFAAQIAFDA